MKRVTKRIKPRKSTGQRQGCQLNTVVTDVGHVHVPFRRSKTVRIRRVFLFSWKKKSKTFSPHPTDPRTSSFSNQISDLKSQIESLKAEVHSAKQKSADVEKEQEDLLVLLDELSAKRRRDKDTMRKAGLEVSEDEGDGDDDDEE